MLSPHVVICQIFSSLMLLLLHFISWHPLINSSLQALLISVRYDINRESSYREPLDFASLKSQLAVQYCCCYVTYAAKLHQDEHLAKRGGVGLPKATLPSVYCYLFGLFSCSNAQNVLPFLLTVFGYGNSSFAVAGLYSLNTHAYLLGRVFLFFIFCIFYSAVQLYNHLCLSACKHVCCSARFCEPAIVT